VELEALTYIPLGGHDPDNSSLFTRIDNLPLFGQLFEVPPPLMNRASLLTSARSF
jgi:hypothetical protein